MITYSWIIEQCQHNVADGFITSASWRCNAVDGEYAATVYGSVGFGEGSPTIPYANVTQAEVLDWAWAHGVDKDAVEANLASQIELLKNPVQESGLPWAQS